MRTFESAYANTALLIASIFLLLGLGMVTLYSSSFGTLFFKNQIIFCAIGLLLFAGTAAIDIEIIRKYAIKPLFILALVLCVLTFIPGIGVKYNEARRWISFGSFTYQPSELVKFVLPLYLAHFFDRKQNLINDFSKGILPPVLIITLFCALVILQNSYSTAVFIALNALLVLFVAGIRLRYFNSVVFVYALVAVQLILSKTHRVERVGRFMHRILSRFFPHLFQNQSEQEVQRAKDQLEYSMDAIQSGGFFGNGIGLGTRRVASVPEIHSDFIFAAYCEETGFLGVALFMALMAVFAVWGYKSALGSATLFTRLLGFSLVTTIISQVLLNIAVASGFLPVTGVPLPFFSAGGSSLWTTLICAGLIVNISRYKNQSGMAYGAYGMRGARENLYGK